MIGRLDVPDIMIGKIIRKISGTCKLGFLIIMTYNVLLLLVWIAQRDKTREIGFDIRTQNQFAFWRRWMNVNTKSSYPYPVINWYDLAPLTMNTTTTTKCINTSTTPSFTICVYPPERDKFVSAALLSDGIWEPHITPLFQKALQSYPNATVLDIGANIGYYTLLSAKMGHHVIAVEPSLNNIYHLHAAALLDEDVGRHIKVVQNAISNIQEQNLLTSSVDNQGGIWIKPLLDNLNVSLDMSSVISTMTLNDLNVLLPRTFNCTLVIKIDIEGFECRAFAGAKRLLTSHYIPYIFMEWGKMFSSCHRPTSPCPVRALHKLTELMTHLGYLAYEVHTGVLLDPDRSTKSWRIGDLYWRHKTAVLIQIPFL